MIRRIKNGAIILEQIEDTVLCLWEKTKSFFEFVVWRINDDDEVYWGHYFNNFDDALSYFKEKTNQYKEPLSLLEIKNKTIKEEIDDWLTELNIENYLITIEKGNDDNLYSWSVCEREGGSILNNLAYGSSVDYKTAERQALVIVKSFINLDLKN